MDDTIKLLREYIKNSSIYSKFSNTYIQNTYQRINSYLDNTTVDYHEYRDHFLLNDDCIESYHNDIIQEYICIKITKNSTKNIFRKYNIPLVININTSVNAYDIKTKSIIDAELPQILYYSKYKNNKFTTPYFPEFFFKFLFISELSVEDNTIVAKIVDNINDRIEIPIIYTTKCNKHNLFILFGGLGDNIIIIPILRYLIERDIINGFIYWDEKIKDLINFFFSEIKCYQAKFPAKFISLNFSNKKLYDSNKNYIDYLIDRIQSNCEKKINKDIIYKYYNEKKHLPNLYETEIKNLKNSYKYIIGFQRISATKFNNQFIKEWPWEEAVNFIKLCKKNNILVINFEPSDIYIHNYEKNYSKLDFIHSMMAIQNLDAFIGIDSCFCHACALLAINSITLMQTNHIWFELAAEKFIPYRFNYSVFPQDFQSNFIKADYVFTLLESILEGKKKLYRKITKKEEKEEGVHYEIISN